MNLLSQLQAASRAAKACAPARPARPGDFQSWRGLNGIKALQNAAKRKSKASRKRYAQAMGREWLTRQQIAVRVGASHPMNIAKTIRKMVAEGWMERDGKLYRIAEGRQC